MFTGLLGSCYYLAPQVIDGSYTEKCDVWSCGVLAYLMLAGFCPFDGETEADIHKEILNHNYDFDWEELDHINDEAKDFVAYLLTYDEAERPTAEEALQHPWLQEYRRTSFGSDASTRHLTRQALHHLQHFQTSDCKLKQAACAFIASQLINKQKHCTSQHTEEIDTVFRQLDLECKGNLSPQDIQQRYQELFPQQQEQQQEELSDEDIAQIFLEINFSGSGRIEYSEFMIAQLLARNAIEQETIQAAFHYFDQDGKGFISPEDLKERLLLLNNNNNNNAEEEFHGDETLLEKYIMRRIMEPVDINGNGRIEFEEFKTMLLSRNNSNFRRMSLRRSSSRKTITELQKLSLNNSAITELEEEWSESQTEECL
jgi:calcium-dependent protein kinase